MNGEKIDIIIYIKKLNTYNNILRYIYIYIYLLIFHNVNMRVVS
jgi:hypothetical protein